MTDYDRGPSSPETPLAFDPRRPVRGAGPVPLTLIISAVLLVGLIAAVAFIYRGGVRHPSGPPAQVGAPVGDYKAPAPAETPGPDATAGLTIYKTKNAPDMSNAAPTLAPPPEQPQPRPGEGASPAPDLAGAGPPPPPPPPAVTAKSAPPSAIATLADAVANKPPPAKAAIVAPKAAGAAAGSPPTGAGWVQIGAFSSPALADKGWTDVARLEPAAMAGRGKRVEPTDKDGETFYRTYITGFSSKAAAQAFCDRLKADQRACIVK